MDKRRRAREVPSHKLKEAQLQCLWIEAITNQSPELLAHLAALKIEVREAARADVLKWQRRSKIK